MTTEAHPVSSSPERRQLDLSRVTWLATIVFFGVLPALTVVVLFAAAIQSDEVATDFSQFYGAAEAVLRGDNPYGASGESLTAWGGPYPYPPLPALTAVPLTALALEAAGLLVMAVLVLVALAVPAVLGVRDWRCYGLLLLWPPVISAIQTGNVTLWFALAAAVAWRFRDRAVPVSASIGVTLAAKFFLWPLVVWLAATRRVASALLACAVGAALLLVSWAAIARMKAVRSSPLRPSTSTEASTANPTPSQIARAATDGRPRSRPTMYAVYESEPTVSSNSRRMSG